METSFQIQNYVYNQYKNEHFFHFKNNEIEFWFTVKDTTKNEQPFNRNASVYTVYSQIIDSTLNETGIKGYIRPDDKNFWPKETLIDIPSFYGPLDETSKIIQNIEHVKKLYVEIQRFFEKDFTQTTWQNTIPKEF